MTRVLIIAAVAAVLSGVLGRLLLPLLRALKAGQSIRELGPTWHNNKAGTPMMGGLMFIFAAIICLLIWFLPVRTRDPLCMPPAAVSRLAST